MRISRSKILPGLIVIWIVALAIYFAFPPLEEKLLEGPHILFDYLTWQNGAIDNWGYKILWIIGDLTEGTVHKSLIASIGLLIGGLVAHKLWLKKSDKMGNPICANLGVFPWVVAAAFIGMTVSTLLYSPSLKNGWMPTFLPGCTIPAALVFMYGGGWTVALTGGIISGIVQFPMGCFGIKIATMLGLPSISGNAIFGMAIAGILIMEFVRLLPWMKPIIKAKEEEKKKAAAAPLPELKAGELPPLPPTVGTGVGWMTRRTLSDFTEIYFMGNEIAGAGLILGLIISWVMNPAHPCYGGFTFTSAILASQLMGTSLAIFVHYDKWQKFGWYNTFTASLAQGAFVMTFGTSLPIIIIGALMSSFLCPLFAAALSGKLTRYHGVVGGTGGMGIAIAIEAVIIKLIRPYLPI